MKTLLVKFWNNVLFYFALFNKTLRADAAKMLEATGGLLAFVQKNATNPAVDFALTTIFGANILNDIPEFETILTKAIVALTGIAADQSSPQTDLEFITDFIKWFQAQAPVMQNAISQKLAALLLANKNKNTDSENVYQSITDALLHGSKYTNPTAAATAVSNAQL